MFVYNRQTIADGEDDLWYARVVGNHAVEAAQTERLFVTVVGRVGDMPVPERVVGKDEASGTNERKDQVVILRVLAFVGVDEDEVVLVISYWWLVIGDWWLVI